MSDLCCQWTEMHGPLRLSICQRRLETIRAAEKIVRPLRLLQEISGRDR
jgi:hypothetical protein